MSAAGTLPAGAYQSEPATDPSVGTLRRLRLLAFDTLAAAVWIPWLAAPSAASGMDPVVPGAARVLREVGQLDAVYGRAPTRASSGVRAAEEPPAGEAP